MVSEDELNKEANFKREVAPLLVSYFKERLKKEAEESSLVKIDGALERRLVGLFQIALDQAFDRVARGVAANSSNINSPYQGRKVSHTSRLTGKSGKLLIRGKKSLLSSEEENQKSNKLSLAA
jgi:hypothetical protein